MVRLEGVAASKSAGIAGAARASIRDGGGANDEPSVVDTKGDAARAPERAGMGHRPMVPQKGVILAVGGHGVTGDLAGIVDPPRLAISPAERAQIGHRPILPK